MKNRNIFSIIGRMAVLWEQRKLVRELDIVCKNSMKFSKDYIEKQKDKEEKKAFLDIHITGGTGEHWTYENELLNHLLQKHEKSRSDVDFVINYQRVLESCIQSKFIDQRENEGFCKIKDNEVANTSARFIQISYDKGAEILNRTYFWLKYIAEVFPPLTTIIVTIITAVLTSGAIWWFLLSKLS